MSPGAPGGGNDGLRDLCERSRSKQRQGRKKQLEFHVDCLQ